MQCYRPGDCFHEGIVRQAAEEARLNCVPICQAVRDALADEAIRADEAAYDLALSHVRGWIQHD